MSFIVCIIPSNYSFSCIFHWIFLNLGEAEFEKLCFNYGIELDDVLHEGGEVVYKIELPANRYDLLCAEGLCRSLAIYLKK